MMGSRRREVVPFMADAKAALALCKRTKDDFYLSALRIECWLGTLANTTAAQYAEEKLPNRRKLQLGEAVRIFGELFRDTSDHDFSVLFVHLARFANADGPYSRALRQGYWAMSKEDDFPPLARLARDHNVQRRARVQREFVKRLCDWLDAITHWRIHERFYVSPISFDVDPDTRELAGIGWQQKHFSQLAAVTKAYWQLHHDEAAQRFKDSPKWATVGKAMYSEKTRYQSYPQLDELLIWLWPLVKKHEWTYRDLLNVARAITSRATYPCNTERKLATYCINVLGLHKRRAGKTSRNGEPKGCGAALRLYSGD